MLKLEDNPPVLFPTDSLVSVDGEYWWVAHTKSRFEKAFAWDLHKRGIPFFLPLVDRVVVSGGRKRRSKMPLFPGYVFFRGTPENRYAALLTDRLCQVIEVKEQRKFLSELSGVHQVIAQKGVLDLYPFAAIGKRCRVRTGPFMGIEGVVVAREDRKARFVLLISILGQGASLDIDGDMLEAADQTQ